MTSIHLNFNSFVQESLQREGGAAPAPAKGSLQGREVQVRPHAQGVTPLPLEPGAPAPAKTSSLEQRQARPANTSPTLLRQARSGALPSTAQLLLSTESSGKAVQARSLPTVGQLIARAGPARSDTLLERFLNFFRGDTSSADYKNILTGLKDYHDTCRTGSGQEAQARLDDLTKALDRYGQSGERNQYRAGIIENLRRQITGERTALTNLVAELKNGPLPPGAGLSHALAFTREGVSLKEMTNLMDKGLKLDQTQKARKILEEQRLSAARARPPEGYPGILKGLQQYHDACNLRGTVAGGDGDVAGQAMTLLENLRAITQEYLKTGTNTQPTEAIKDLNDQVFIELQVLRGLHDELRQGGTLPEGADLSHALAFAREGVSLQDMTRLMAKGLLPSQASEARIVLDSERGASLLNDLNSRTPEEKAYLTRSFNESEILLLELSGLGEKGGEEYRRLGIPITRQTIATERTDEQRLGEMSLLGGGAFNKVYTARYSGSEGIVKDVFKPLSSEDSGWVAHKIGIDLNHPQIANRNLATQDVARALGFDVVVDCQIGFGRLPEDRPGTPSELQIGLVMGRAPGEPASRTRPEHYANPEVRREITKLQLLDHLVGQGDRHGGNYFIHVHTDARGKTQVKVSGIDNDQCFGKNTTHGNDIHHAANDKQRSGFRGTKMPELIDTDMAAALRSITPKRLDALLGDKLSPAEVKAARSRLQSLHDHVDRLERKNQVITPTQWNARKDMSAFHTKSNSYFARDAGRARVAF